MLEARNNSMTRRLIAFSAIALGSVLFITAAAQTPSLVKVDSDTISGLGARNIGSAAMSGRITSVAGVKEGQRLTVYVGAASGGGLEIIKCGPNFKTGIY